MIQQVRFSSGVIFFQEKFCHKWGVKPYWDADAPCLFAGVNNMIDVNTVNNHRGFKLILNTGRLRDCFTKIDPQNVVVIINERQDFSSLYAGYKTKMATFPIKDFSNFIPTPLGDKIYCYLGSLKRRESCGYGVMRALAKISPFEIIYGYLGQPIEEVRDNYYTPSFINIKPSLIAGTTSAIEMAYMGRKTISNAKAPFCIKYKDIKEMLSIIMDESKKIGTIQESVISDYFDTGEEWMNENFWQ